MKNSDLLKSRIPTKLLTNLESQRKFVLLTMSYRLPCPSCGQVQNQFEAMGIDVDAYDLTKNIEKVCICTSCKRPLLEVVPLMKLNEAGWYWEVNLAAEHPMERCQKCNELGANHRYKPHQFFSK